MYYCWSAKIPVRVLVYTPIRALVYNTDLGAKLVSTISGTKYDELVKPKNTRAEYIQALYQIMKDVHYAFEAAGVEYWADGGTLLGVVRHKGIIPWDDDLDIDFHESDYDKVQSKILPTLKELGYTIAGNGDLFQVIAPPSMIKLNANERLPACDIFVTREKNGRLTIQGWPNSIKISDLKPLKLYKFGDFEIWGNANPIPYLNDLYGTNWSKLANRGNDHKTIDGSEASRLPFSMSEHEYAPAVISSPLIDNLDKIKQIMQSY